MKRLLTILLVVASALPSVLRAQDMPSPALLILAKRDSMMLIVDPSTLNVVARVPVGNDPHEVIASSDGKTAYVTNYGGGAYNTLAVVDLVAQKPLPAIDLGALRGPHGITFVGGKVWFTAEGAKAIGSYDPASNKVDWIFGTGQNRTHMIYVSPDMTRVLTTNVASATVSIIDKVARTQRPAGPPPGFPQAGAPQGGPPPGPPPGSPAFDWNQTLVRVGNGSEGFDLSLDGKEMWVANAQDGTVSVIDLASKQVAQTLALDVRGANRLKFAPDGKLVLISSLGSPDVTVVDAVTHKTIKKIRVGRGSAGIQMQPDGSRAFVACSPYGYVVVIDLHSLEVTGHIDAGHDPDGLAWVVRR